MKKPILGKSTSLKDHGDGLKSFTAFVNESAKRQKEKESRPIYTGRHFVIQQDATSGMESAKSILKDELGTPMAFTSDFTKEITNDDLDNADALIYDDLGIALIGLEEEELNLLEQKQDNYIIIPELVAYVPDDEAAYFAEKSTWGLNATQALNSNYTGKGVNVAVLDTGFDKRHPDFKNRNITSLSFVAGETPQDVQGHGTHCIGTACGDIDAQGVRYGVANEANIFALKVLNNNGSGAQADIINAMRWAINNDCQVISMSLGAPTRPGDSYHMAYERIAKYALQNGSVIVAAAGNESRRSRQHYAPVGRPANSPSILAVGALDQNLNVADFSCRSINPNGQIDIAAPGVNVHSSYPLNKRYRRLNGTSMATPHVAGILALLWEKYPNATSNQIINEMFKLARRLNIPSVDVGAGIAIAP